MNNLKHVNILNTTNIINILYLYKQKNFNLLQKYLYQINNNYIDNKNEQYKNCIIENHKKQLTPYMLSRGYYSNKYLTDKIIQINNINYLLKTPIDFMKKVKNVDGTYSIFTHIIDTHSMSEKDYLYYNNIKLQLYYWLGSSQVILHYVNTNNTNTNIYYISKEKNIQRQISYIIQHLSNEYFDINKYEQKISFDLKEIADLDSYIYIILQRLQNLKKEKRKIQKAYQKNLNDLYYFMFLSKINKIKINDETYTLKNNNL